MQSQLALQTNINDLSFMQSQKISILLLSITISECSKLIYFNLVQKINKIMRQKKNSPEKLDNISTIGYKTFASQFTDQSKQGKEHQQYQNKVFAIKKGKLSLLHSIGFGNNASFLQKNRNQLTLLHYAAYFNSPTCALYLLHQNVKISSLDKQGKSVFHLCSYTGHIDVLIYIHEFWKMSKIKQANEKFFKILSKIGFKRTDAKQGKLKTQVSKERTARFKKGQQQISQLYRQYRKQYNEFILNSYQLQDTSYNRNCFHYIALNKYQRCQIALEYMIKSLHNQDLVLSQDLLMNLNEIYPLVSQSIDPRQLGDALSIMRDFIQPQTLKDIAEQDNHRIRSQMIKILQAKDKDNHNAIYLASKTGSAAIVALLRRVQEKYCPNKLSATCTSDDVIKIALNNPVRNQITDLCQASKNADVEIMNFLISCGEQVNQKKSIFGTFPLLQAIKAFQKEKNIQPINILLKSGADVNEQDSNGWTIFHHIAEKGFTQILKQIFVQRDQKRIAKLHINKCTNKGYHPLHIAALNDQTQVIQTMMNKENAYKYSIETNPVDEQKSTILHSAARKGSLKTVRKILQLKGGALVGLRDVNDNTCLHLAAANNHVQCVRQIIQFDSDCDNLIRLRNKKGKLAKDLTLKKRCFDSVFTAARQGDVNMIRNLANQNPAVIDSCTPVKKRTPLILAVIEMQLVNVKFLVDLSADQYHEDTDKKTASDYARQLEQVHIKKDRSKIPLIKKIRSLLD